MWINPKDRFGGGSTSCSVFINRPKAVVGPAAGLPWQVSGSPSQQAEPGSGSSGCWRPGRGSTHCAFLLLSVQFQI